MKYHSIIILLLILPFCSVANRIDSLKTYADVNKLLKEVDPRGRITLDSNTYDRTYYIPVEIRIADSLQNRAWQKVDLNNDGRTDLLIHSYSDLIAIIDDNGKLKFFRLTKELDPPTLFTSVRKEGNDVKLFIYTINDKCKDYDYKDYRSRKIKGPLRMNCTTLVYKYGNFIEFNSNPKPSKNNIREIVYKTSACYGWCPVFNMNILTANREATYESIKFSGTAGTYTATIDTASFNKIMAIINYIDIESLAKNYRVGATDLPGCDFGVIYTNGGVKNIDDYGKRGTYGLMALYEELEALTKNQAWKPTGQ